MTSTHQLVLQLTVVLAFATTLWAMLALRQESRLRREAELHISYLLDRFGDHTDNVLTPLRDTQPECACEVYDWEKS